jgi:predicted ribonuclease toxin of YeeF-YezG toxin-antitoxin module
MLVSMTGVGVAADRAIPGDFLYPLDRALEALGLSSDLVEERLLEAITLTERGDMDQAIITANEALAELGRSGVTATLPEVATETLELTAETVEEPSTTTTDTEPEIAAVTDTADDAETEPVVEAAADPVTAVEALRLAAEQLLQSVRTAKTDPTTSGEVTTAALFLAEATASVPATEEIDTTTSTSSTTTPSSTTTTTTAPEDPRPGNRGGNGNESGTTTTTVASDPDDGSGSDDSTDDGEASPPGPIFLPAP